MSLVRWGADGSDVYVWAAAPDPGPAQRLQVWVDSPDGVVKTEHSMTAEVEQRLLEVQRLGFTVPDWVIERVHDLQGSW